MLGALYIFGQNCTAVLQKNRRRSFKKQIQFSPKTSEEGSFEEWFRKQVEKNSKYNKLPKKRRLTNFVTVRLDKSGSVEI